MTRGQTPSQTVGPFFAYGLTPKQYRYDFPSVADAELHDLGTEGRSIDIYGYIFDGAGEVIPDAMIEIWQADPQAAMHSRAISATAASLASAAAAPAALPRGSSASEHTSPVPSTICRPPMFRSWSSCVAS